MGIDSIEKLIQEEPPKVKFVGFVALLPLQADGKQFKFGDIVPGAKDWPNIHALVTQGFLAPAVVLDNTAGVITQEEKELEKIDTEEDSKKKSELISEEDSFDEIDEIKENNKKRKPGRPKKTYKFSGLEE